MTNFKIKDVGEGWSVFTEWFGADRVVFSTSERDEFRAIRVCQTWIKTEEAAEVEAEWEADRSDWIAIGRVAGETTETHCHCGAAFDGCDHCGECFCEQYERHCDHVAVAA